MDATLIIDRETAIAFLTATAMLIGLAMVLGYLGQKLIGLVLLGLKAIIVSGLCLAGLMVGYAWGGETGAWTGLLLSIALSGGLLAWAFVKITRVARSGCFLAGAWFIFCLLAISGYLAGRWVGLLTLTLPVIFLFWLELYRLSGDLLPLNDKRNRKDRAKALRALITFTMGTNYPFYVVSKNSQLVKRVDGNPFRGLFAGPGFVVTDCDHAVYLTSGVFVTGVFGPGLTFTGRFEENPRIIDLRPQLRAFPVEALTKDGIPIKVTTFIPYRIDAGNQAVEPGHPFPFRQNAVHQAMAGELVERKPDATDQKSGQKHHWDGGPEDGLVPLLVTPVVQEIISRYKIDELCAPFDKDRDPRMEIINAMKRRVKELLRGHGLEILGGGISNLVPQDESVIKRRVDNWRTKWIGHVLTQMSAAQAYRRNQLDLARVKAEIEIIRRFGQNTKASLRDELRHTLAFGLIDAIGDVVGGRDAQWPLPNKELEETLKRLRGEM
jgi:hypothetical protein